MKKTTAVIFLAIANMILLAHAVVPHHHHHEAIVVNLSGSHCDECPRYDDDCRDHNQDKEAKDHSHKGGGQSENCTIQQVLVRAPGDDSRYSLLSDGLDSNPVIYPLFFYAQACCEPFIDESNGLPLRQNPYISSYHSIFAASSIGLRAPPVC